MDSSPFGTLPAELRNDIYELVLLSEEPILVHCEAAATPGVPRKYRYLPGIIATCKQVRNECEQIFFKRNTSQVGISPRPAKIELTPYRDEAHALWAFLNGLQRVHFSMPKHITFKISRSYSQLSCSISQHFQGAEIRHLLYEIEKFTLGRQIEKVECEIESTWGITATHESTVIDMNNMSHSAITGFGAFLDKYPSGTRAYHPDSIVCHFHWKVMKNLSVACEAREEKRLAKQEWGRHS
ncbi:hypothetical protein CB0940_02163 [Cercospora beticola]|uniref:Uncharacterized protein n=1 Tax=Cercospora beticola TaxID=122368 RepID=A0A2G5I7P0_CERBT|nr:hypothetical protein CB0940_02163 [Cercospora beticola]PIB00785.1 hypothetical protein CB0940_02163 [Cercospora beticola]WPA97701.1 hypothetical protein RHO25_002312 [Cercospora beticola]